MHRNRPYRRCKGSAFRNVEQLEQVGIPVPLSAEQYHIRGQIVAPIEGGGLVTFARDHHEDVDQNNQNSKCAGSGEKTSLERVLDTALGANLACEETSPLHSRQGGRCHGSIRRSLLVR